MLICCLNAVRGWKQVMWHSYSSCVHWASKNYSFMPLAMGFHKCEVRHSQSQLPCAVYHNETGECKDRNLLEFSYYYYYFWEPCEPLFVGCFYTITYCAAKRHLTRTYPLVLQSVPRKDPKPTGGFLHNKLNGNFRFYRVSYDIDFIGLLTANSH